MGNDKRREVTNRIISLLEQTDISQGYPNLYQRIKEWINEIPTEKAHDGDLVSRKDAIDAILSLPRWVFTDNGEFQPVDAKTMSMIDPDDAVSAIENLPSARLGTMAVRGYPIDADYLMAKVAEEYGERARDALYRIIRYMPPAQPDIIHCRECKHSEHWYSDRRRCFLWSEVGISVFNDGFCNYAERREE